MKQGNILHIDLTTKTSSLERDEALFEKYLGGTAAATELLFRHGHPRSSAYAPENPVIFAIGPFNSVYPVATKTVALFKSPLTGDLGESHAGGRLSLALHEARIDALVITGKADKPCYIVIENDQVEFKSAATFWGNSATSTERIIRDAESGVEGKLSVLRIGPAGERLSRIACVTVDSSRHFGRTGLGGVMGSKNLKAIAICGYLGSPVENAKAYREIYDELYKRVVASKNMHKYHDLGTAINVAPLSEIGGLPTRNFSQGNFEDASLISGESFAKDYLAQHTACAHCQCGCIHLATLREEFKPWHYTTTKISYDYELIYSLGSVLGLNVPDDILRLILFVEKQGWDAISIGVTLAWATEALARGAITLETTDGLPLAFGDAGTYLEALSRCAKGQGEFFRDLESGSAFCAGKYGGEAFAIQYGGVEPGGYMTGENFAVTSLLGVRHSHLDDTGYSIDQSLPNPKITLEEQVRTQVKEAQWRMILNSLTICLFARAIYDREIILKGLGALGLSWSDEKIDELASSTLRRKHEWRKLCGLDLSALRIPEKMYGVQSASGQISQETIRERVRLYREFAGI